MICTGIVELHGGQIGCMSKGEGQGSTFFVDLPCSLLSEESMHPVPRNPRPTTLSVHSNDDSEGASSMRVLFPSPHRSINKNNGHEISSERLSVSPQSKLRSPGTGGGLFGNGSGSSSPSRTHPLASSFYLHDDEEANLSTASTQVKQRDADIHIPSSVLRAERDEDMLRGL